MQIVLRLPNLKIFKPKPKLKKQRFSILPNDLKVLQRNMRIYKHTKTALNDVIWNYINFHHFQIEIRTKLTQISFKQF